MSQLDFILCIEEREEVMQYVLKNGCQIIPNHQYKNPEYIIASDLEGYLQNCKKEPLLFLTNKKYSMYPLELDFINDNSEKRYFIKQRYGGPTIDFFSPVLAEIEDAIIGPGYIGFYPFYYHGKNKFFPDKNLLIFFKSFSVFIRKISRKVILKNRTYWIGKSTIEKAKRKEINILPISNISITELINKY